MTVDPSLDHLVDTGVSGRPTVSAGVLDAPPRDSLSVRVARVAAIAAAHADEVDRDARFPHEAVDAMRAEGLLAAGVPAALGGGGARLAELVDAARAVGRACSATSTVFTMHQIQIACIVRHAHGAALDAVLRSVAEDGLLVGSCTTEAGRGGDARNSTCVVERPEPGRYALRKTAPVISYGEYADAILVTARRTEDSPPGDQVMVLCLRAGLSLAPTSQWDALGYRGTCSRGHELTASGDAQLILDEPYDSISTATMVPWSHLLWAASWHGLAVGLGATVGKLLQSQARKSGGAPVNIRAAELRTALFTLEALVSDGLRRVTEADSGAGAPLDSFSNVIAFNTLKIRASELVVDVATRALAILGMPGYVNAGPLSVSRQVRDALGAPLMLNNDRLLQTNAQLLLGVRDV